MKFILNNSKAGKGAQDTLKKTFKDNQKKFVKMENNLKKEESDLIGQKGSLTKEEYQKKANVLRKKVIDYQSQRKLSLEKIASQRLKAKDELLKALDPLLNKYIADNNISVVIDKKNIIGGQNSFDITNVMIEQLNKELPSISLK